ncbi:MAG: hypothetical protein Q7S95_03345 [bacterium]|nr:hypothetical protein [bacterium]
MRGQLMPARTERGWHVITAGPVLDIMYHDDRRLAGHEGDGIRRRTIVIAVKGPNRQRRRIQRIRLDPFSEGAHGHILPRPGEPQFPLVLREGQAPLDAALEILGTRNKLRPMLAKARVANLLLERITRENCMRAATAIRTIAETHAA